MSAGTTTIYATSPRFWARQWWLLRQSAISAYEDNCFGVAKGAAYSALLSFFPVLTTSAALLSQANATSVYRVISGLLFEAIPPGSESLLINHLRDTGGRPKTLLIVATLLSIWAASGMMMSLMEGFQAAYRLPHGRPFLKQRGMAVVLVFAAAIPTLAASSLILFGSRTESSFIRWVIFMPEGASIRQSVLLVGRSARYLVAFGGIVLSMALFYFFGPNRTQKLHRMWPGALVATSLWLIATSVFAWYVTHVANYNVLYGSIGAVIALLVWMYFLAVIVLVGCEFNALAERTE